MRDERQEVDLEPSEILAREHRLIERSLDALGQICSQALRAGQLDARAAEVALRFLREFADHSHHLKEEQVLFPAIEAKAFFPGCGLVREHEEGRQRVRRMGAAVPYASHGDREAIRTFVRTARSLILALREHIAKEDDCLAEVVATSLSREDRQAVARQFEELERREAGERSFERASAMVEELERWCGQPRRSPGSPP